MQKIVFIAVLGFVIMAFAPGKFQQNINHKMVTDDVTIRFPEFSLKIDSLPIWDETHKLQQEQKDTAYVYLELGETVEDKLLKIIPNKEAKFYLLQRYENSISVSDEDGHCDLLNWKHYDSQWERLDITNNTFRTVGYTREEKEMFIATDMNEFKAEVLAHCGETYSAAIQTIDSPNTYPSYVTMSRIYLKFMIELPYAAKPIYRVVVFEYPMGC